MIALMTAHTVTTTNRDRKRYLWLASPLTIIIPPLCILGFFTLTASPLWCLVPLLVLFGIIPILDMLIGEDSTNLSDAAQDKLEHDPYYRLILWGSIPLYYLGYFSGIWFVMNAPLPLWAQIAFIAGVGFTNGGANNVGHEMGHKKSKLDQFGALLVLTAIGNGHFNAEHNLNHHSKVATPDDPSSARMGETLYAFAVRDMIGAIKGAWQLERRRLSIKEYRFVHWRNKLLMSWGSTALITLTLTLIFGLGVLPFILLYSFLAFYTLSLANYVEHYGLLRQKRENGKYEPCQPRHSWNTNHLVSNIVTLHLQRHSDHHTYPFRPYQILRNYDKLPSLPSGYPGSFLLAAIPPLWFKIMNPKVMDWADKDLEKVNLCPKAKARLRKQWG